jgi:LAO/AO transport system kinase
MFEKTMPEGDTGGRAKTAAAEYRAALAILSPRSRSWSPPVTTYSALTGAGIAELWGTILDHRQRMQESGELAARRREQQVKWMWSMLEDRMFARLRSDPALRAKLPRIEAEVAAGRMTPGTAVDEIAAWLRI